MTVFEQGFPATRPRVLQLLALLGVGGSALLKAARALAESDDQAADVWPEMTYRTLGQTGFRGSRLVFGCGAALMFWGKDELLNEAFEHGVNVFDVGTSDYYRNAEENLAGFAVSGAGPEPDGPRDGSCRRLLRDGGQQCLSRP
jgi:hypothetical protein